MGRKWYQVEQSIISKLGVSDRTHAAIAALRLGLVE